MIEVNGKKYKIGFKHKQYLTHAVDGEEVITLPPVTITLPLSGSIREILGETVCRIDIETKDKIICSDGKERSEYALAGGGTTYCSSLDAPYSKYKGKKHALEHALWKDRKGTNGEGKPVDVRVSMFTREERTAIWDWFKREWGVEERQPSTINKVELARRKKK